MRRGRREKKKGEENSQEAKKSVECGEELLLRSE
jgi:hypothetical protein